MSQIELDEPEPPSSQAPSLEKVHVFSQAPLIIAITKMYRLMGNEMGGDKYDDVCGANGDGE
jgi:hypothetical protein